MVQRFLTFACGQSMPPTAWNAKRKLARAARAACVILVVIWFWEPGCTSIGRLTLQHEGPSSRSDAFETQNVLAKSALVDFDRELPHAWQRIGDYLLRPVTWMLPRTASAPPLVFGGDAMHVLGKSGLTKGCLAVVCMQVLLNSNDLFQMVFI
eukprot:s971_g28.t1